MSITVADGARPRSPKRKRDDYDEAVLPPSKSRIQADFDGYAYEDSPLPSSPSSSPVEPSTPLPPQRPTALSYQAHSTLHGHTSSVSTVKFSPCGTLLASASSDATIKIWAFPSLAVQHTLQGHLAGISTLAWNPDSTVLASGSDDKSIRLWDVKAGKSFPTPLLGHSNYVYSVAFSPKGNMLASGSYDEAVFLWDVRTARVMRSLPAHSDPVSGVDFVMDGTLVASCSSDGLIRIWDSGTGQCLKTLVHEDHKPVGAVRFSPNGKFVAAATLDSTVRLWSYVDGRVVKTYFGGKNERYSAAVCFGRYRAVQGGEEWGYIATGSEDGTVVLWDVNTKEILQRFEAHDGPVLGVDTSPEGDVIATCGLDGKVRTWKLQLDEQEEVQIADKGEEEEVQDVQVAVKEEAIDTNGTNGHV